MLYIIYKYINYYIDNKYNHIELITIPPFNNSLVNLSIYKSYRYS